MFSEGRPMKIYRNKVSILYVEDEDNIREGYAKALKRISSNLQTAADGEEGLALYKKHHFELIVSDIKMPKMNGIEMVKEIKKLNPEISIIFTSAHTESAYLLEAIELQVDGYLLKPVDKKSLTALVQKLSKNILLQKENEIQREILQHIMDSENSLSIITDGKAISYASKSFLNLFNITKIGDFKEPSLFAYINSKDDAHRTINVKNKSFFISISKIRDNNFLLNLTDITKMEKDRVETVQKAYVDTLTQVYNRNKFEEVFEYQLRQAKRYKQNFSLAILDIDHFKLFNDTYGHLVGDEILILLAKKILENLRESDLFARWGGEEFVILFNNTTLQDAAELCEKFRQNIQSIKHESPEIIRASFGVTEYKENDTINSMFERADRALYTAKGAGRDQVRSVV